MQTLLDREIAVREAILREIRDATRWQTVLVAWEALLNVRRVGGKVQIQAMREKMDEQESKAPLLPQ